MSWNRIEWGIDAVRERVTINESGCWIWHLVRKDGYGSQNVNRRTVEAHRHVYEVLVGPIPEGMHIDHLCHTNDPACQGGTTCPHRACVNPAHLEAVTRLENERRKHKWKTHCVNGHPLDGWNLVTYGGHRACRTCMYERNRGRPRAKEHRCLGCGKRTTVPSKVCHPCARSGVQAA